MPIYTPVTYERPDLMTATGRFLDAYLRPYGLSDAIIRGWRNRNALPPGTTRYVVYDLSASSRVGTNIDGGVGPDGAMRSKTLFKARVQIDFCSDDDDAHLWAEAVASIVRSEIGAAFFKDYGIGSCYADDPLTVDFADASEQRLKRSSLVCHLTYYVASVVTVEYAAGVALRRLENVDAHHKPRG